MPVTLFLIFAVVVCALAIAGIRAFSRVFDPEKLAQTLESHVRGALDQAGLDISDADVRVRVEGAGGAQRGPEDWRTRGHAPPSRDASPAPALPEATHSPPAPVTGPTPYLIDASPPVPVSSGLSLNAVVAICIILTIVTLVAELF